MRRDDAETARSPCCDTPSNIVQVLRGYRLQGTAQRYEHCDFRSRSQTSRYIEELATTGSTGVLIAAQPAPSTGYDSASIDYAFGDSPADAIAALDGVDINNSSTICIYRYNDSIPLLPEVRPCKAVAQEVASTQQLRAALDELQIVRTDLAELRILASQNQRALERSQETIARISDRVDAIAETSAEIYNLIQPQLPPFAAPDPGADRTE